MTQIIVAYQLHDGRWKAFSTAYTVEQIDRALLLLDQIYGVRGDVFDHEEFLRIPRANRVGA